MKIFVFNFLIFVTSILMQFSFAEAAKKTIQVNDDVAVAEDAQGAARQEKLSAEEIEQILAATGTQAETANTNSENKNNTATDADLTDEQVSQQIAQAATSANAKESEIPVFKNSVAAQKANTSSSNGLWMSFIILAAFAFAGIIAIKKYGKTKNTDLNGKIKVLTQHYLGPKKSLVLVRIAGESILIGVTDNSITHIKTLSLLDEDLPEETPQHFANALGDYAIDDEGMHEKENFSFTGIKDVVHTKFKNMRNY